MFRELFMLRRFFLFSTTLVLPLIYGGCFFVNMFDFGPSIDLSKHNWRIVSFDLDGEIYQAKDFEQIPSMRFDTEELKLRGDTGCNIFFANYVWLKDKDNVIEMRNSGMTRKMCASPEAMKFEQKLMEDFDGEFKVIEDKENLILKKETLTINLEPLNAPIGEDSDSKDASAKAE